MEIINTVFVSNNNYFLPLTIAVYSLLKNFSSSKYLLQINIIENEILENNKEKIRNIGKRFNTEINFINTKTIKIPDFPNAKRYTQTAYYKLFIPEFFKGKSSKVLYFDCDVLIIKNIVELYEEKIDSYLLGAVEDRGWEYLRKKNEFYYKNIENYFNSGVLLINIDKWVKDNTTQKIIDFSKKKLPELHTADQDIFNYICNNEWLKLHEKWNFQINRHQKRIQQEPNILHFSTWYKPWYIFYNNHYNLYYKKYMRDFPNFKKKNLGIKITIKEILKNVIHWLK